MQFLGHCRHAQRPLLVQQTHEYRLHTTLGLAGRQLQDAQVLLGGPLRLLLPQHIVGQAEATAGKQVGPVAIIGKGSGLADQPVDDVPILDLVFAPAPQAGQLLHLPLGVPDLDPLGIQAGFHPLADEPARHRVDVARHMNGAAAVHSHLQPFARLQTPLRQGPQQGQLLGQANVPTSIGLRKQQAQERLVSIPTGEIPAAPQHQRLVQCPLELVMALLHVAVLMALAGLDGLGLQSVMVQQSLVTLLEHLGSFAAWLDGRRQPISTVQLGHAAQLPQGVLHPLAETLQALRETEGACLPVGVGQDEVIDQVVERNAVDGHAQVGAMGEVAGTKSSGVMNLGEEDLLGGALQGAPLPAAPLQGPQLAVSKATRETPLQVGKDGLGLQSGVELKQLLDLGPDLGEGISSSPPVPVHAFDLAGELAEPAILAGALGVHAGLEGSPFFGSPLLLQTTELPHLRIGEHRVPPCQEAR
jgi:hypothetical protein